MLQNAEELQFIWTYPCLYINNGKFEEIVTLLFFVFHLVQMHCASWLMIVFFVHLSFQLMELWDLMSYDNLFSWFLAEISASTNWKEILILLTMNICNTCSTCKKCEFHGGAASPAYMIFTYIKLQVTTLYYIYIYFT